MALSYSQNQFFSSLPRTIKLWEKSSEKPKENKLFFLRETLWNLWQFQFTLERRACFVSFGFIAKRTSLERHRFPFRWPFSWAFRLLLWCTQCVKRHLHRSKLNFVCVFECACVLTKKNLLIKLNAFEMRRNENPKQHRQYPSDLIYCSYRIQLFSKIFFVTMAEDRKGNQQNENDIHDDTFKTKQTETTEKNCRFERKWEDENGMIFATEELLWFGTRRFDNIFRFFFISNSPFSLALSWHFGVKQRNWHQRRNVRDEIGQRKRRVEVWSVRCDRWVSVKLNWIERLQCFSSRLLRFIFALWFNLFRLSFVVDDNKLLARKCVDCFD